MIFPDFPGIFSAFFRESGNCFFREFPGNREQALAVPFLELMNSSKSAVFSTRAHSLMSDLDLTLARIACSTPQPVPGTKWAPRAISFMLHTVASHVMASKLSAKSMASSLVQDPWRLTWWVINLGNESNKQLPRILRRFSKQHNTKQYFAYLVRLRP